MQELAAKHALYLTDHMTYAKSHLDVTEWLTAALNRLDSVQDSSSDDRSILEQKLSQTKVRIYCIF